MRIKTIFIFSLIIIAAGCRPPEIKPSAMREVTVLFGDIKSSISVTGSVLPRNRLEIKPPIAGRIESILVKEGQMVKKGAIVAWMSSTERAALLDASQGQDEATQVRLANAYKPIALIAPIDGQVIVSSMQPGQSVAASDVVVVLSDILIVRAVVDETDIAKVSIGQEAFVVIDAYSDNKVKATVEHIYYESETVNNVTTYKVDLVTEDVPEFFKSGMNATIDLICAQKQDVLLVPTTVVSKEGKDYYVMLKNDTDTPLRQRVVLGINDDKNSEVISGLQEGDVILAGESKYRLPQKDSSSNPFMPKRPGMGKNNDRNKKSQ